MLTRARKMLQASANEMPLRVASSDSAREWRKHINCRCSSDLRLEFIFLPRENREDSDWWFFLRRCWWRISVISIFSLFFPFFKRNSKMRGEWNLSKYILTPTHATCFDSSLSASHRPTQAARIYVHMFEISLKVFFLLSFLIERRFLWLDSTHERRT